jgi:hypothetical protein
MSVPVRRDEFGGPRHVALLEHRRDPLVFVGRGDNPAGRPHERVLVSVRPAFEQFDRLDQHWIGGADQRQVPLRVERDGA